MQYNEQVYVRLRLTCSTMVDSPVYLRQYSLRSPRRHSKYPPARPPHQDTESHPSKDSFLMNLTQVILVHRDSQSHRCTVSASSISDSLTSTDTPATSSSRILIPKEKTPMTSELNSFLSTTVCACQKYLRILISNGYIGLKRPYLSPISSWSTSPHWSHSKTLPSSAVNFHC